MNNEDSFFYQALVNHFAPSKGHPQYDVWLNYALETNTRGQYTVSKLQEFFPSLKAKRHLDIGCGYGGTCIAVARAGAESIGIDINDQLLEFAGLNKKDYPGLQASFAHLDVMNWDEIHSLGQFDIITVDNVIEHVSVPERLIAHLWKLLKDDGLAYITIPNAFSTGQVRSDCHYGLFGISLLDPWDAAMYVRHALAHPSYDVSFYYTYDRYQGLFEKYAFQVKLLNYTQPAEQDVQEIGRQGMLLEEELQTHQSAGKIPDELSQKLTWALAAYHQQLSTGVDHYQGVKAGEARARLGWQLLRDYRDEVWYVVLFKSSKRASGSLTAALRRVWRGARRRVRSFL